MEGHDDFQMPEGFDAPPDDLEELGAGEEAEPEAEGGDMETAASGRAGLAPGDARWGRVTYDDGRVDLTSWYHTPVNGDVRSLVAFYESRTIGSAVLQIGWYTHRNQQAGTRVGRRWRGDIPPRAKEALVWWQGGGGAVTPFRTLHR